MVRIQTIIKFSFLFLSQPDLLRNLRNSVPYTLNELDASGMLKLNTVACVNALMAFQLIMIAAGLPSPYRLSQRYPERSR